jgi:AmiR/NasT family two-component response regulator
VGLGELFAAPAAIAVRNAAVLAHANRLAEQLQLALESRAVIDQAIGVLMGSRGCSADEALAALRSESQSRHEKLNVVAQTVVDQGIRRARSRLRAQRDHPGEKDQSE